MSSINRPILSYVNDFLEYCSVEKGLSNQTVKNYNHFLRQFKKWLESNHLLSLKPNELSKDHIWDYRLFLSRRMAQKKGLNLKKSTQSYYLIALRGLLDYFAEKDIKSLSSEKIKLPKEQKDKSVKFMTLDQLERLLTAPDVSTMNGLRDRAILETLFSTGLRVSELSSLNRNQINLLGVMKGTIHDQELSIIGKGERPRVVFLSERCLKWIKKYLNKRVDIDEALFIHFKTGHVVNSKRLTPYSIERIVKKYAKIVGLEVLATPHTIRHTFATDLLNQGIDLRSIQELLGHKNIVTTQIYTHVTNKKLRDVHRQFHSGRKLKS